MDNINIPDPKPVIPMRPSGGCMNEVVYSVVVAISLLGLAAGGFYYFNKTQKSTQPATLAYKYEDTESRLILFELEYNQNLMKKDDISETTFSNIPIENSFDLPKGAYVINIEVAIISNCWNDMDVQESVKYSYDVEEPTQSVIVDGISSQRFIIKNEDKKIVTAILLEEKLVEVSFETELAAGSAQYIEGMANYTAIVDSLKFNPDFKKKPKTAQPPVKTYPIKHLSNSYVEFDYYDMPFMRDITDSMKDDGVGRVSFVSDFNCDPVSTSVTRTPNILNITIESRLEAYKQNIPTERSVVREYELGGKKYILVYEPVFDEVDGLSIGTFELLIFDTNFTYSIDQIWTNEVNNQSQDRIDFGGLIVNSIKFK